MPRVQALLQSTGAPGAGAVTRISDRLAESFRQVHVEMENSPPMIIELPELAAPPVPQWWTPLLLGGCLAG